MTSEQKVAVITGASRGIGAGLLKAYRDIGYHVVATSRSIGKSEDPSEGLLVRFDERPGDWMYHCHILDHADGGMMGIVAVDTAGTTSHLDHSGRSR